MKKFTITLIIILILLLDFAALDDITTGNELNYTGEFLTLVFSLPLLYLLVKRVRNK